MNRFLGHNLGGTWKGIPFIGGHRYRVLRAAHSYLGELVVGEVLEFYGASYSHYDAMSVWASPRLVGAPKGRIILPKERSHGTTEVHA